jgi:SAM-dependent methyltransferase
MPLAGVARLTCLGTVPVRCPCWRTGCSSEHGTTTGPAWWWAVGCGLGIDAEYIAANGFQTTAFDISETAVRTATERYPNSPVSYCRADLLSVPSAWLRAFDLVVEIITIQGLPLAVRPQAVAAVASLVAAGGTLLAIENVRQDSDPMPDRPPWPFSRPEIESFAENGLETVAIDQNIDPVRGPRWRAEFTRHMP